MRSEALGLEVKETSKAFPQSAGTPSKEVNIRRSGTKAKIEYDEDWKTGEEWKVELESILSAQKIPLEAEGG